MGFSIRNGRFVRVLLAGILAVGLFPAMAWSDPAQDTSLVDEIVAQNSAAVERFEATNNPDELMRTDAYNGDGASMLRSRAVLPAKLDLRDKGVVTPVKLQNPWGTCWSFGAIAAAETSLMTDLGLDANAGDAPINLSELHTAWFSYMPLIKEGNPQSGEGVYPVDQDGNKDFTSASVLNQGGYPFTATSIFSSGIGVVDEDTVPYKNKENKKEENGDSWYYSADGDWSVNETERFVQVFELAESSVLPTPAGRDDTQEYVHDAAGTNAIKKELSAGRAVEIGFAADTSRPGDPGGSQYINTNTWAHYTYNKDAPVNHAVTIVGWDDDYAASNFLAAHQPDKPGAWIVKNSWGSKTEASPHNNQAGWGVDGSGYFYLSYYDQTISMPETFKFDIDEDEDYYINQYDYMPSAGVTSAAADTPTSMANIFEAGIGQNVRALSCETASPNTEVTYELYLLNDGYTNPKDGKPLGQWTETYEYGGYHRLSLDTGHPVKKGQHYSVVVTEKVGSKYEFLIEKGINKTGWDKYKKEGVLFNQYSVGIVNKGESIYTQDNGATWIDWADTVKEIKGATPGGDIFDFDNFAIKAYSDPLPVVVSAVPDLSNMTEPEAVAALEELGFTGKAGQPEYSDSIEKDRVMGQDIQAGTEKEEGSVITYILSLGKEPAAIPPATDKSVVSNPLAATGDNTLVVVGIVGFVTLLAGGVVLASIRLRKKYKPNNV